ncbi:Os1348 family NHLP clan protein [Glycomyces sp. TRM65418]|uniref:Os1348 family NHLP clan protein n=1 Tax=Glycomyces sp. TRM65418 TaxID=2867006 RepID=UPI001CE6FDFC|nr:Os1348 family NHLP clan protein [Glycomyces sp. TRM65418]MCC3765502.1 Os1348 family NHLP clan protein [Glycomyces sp. TRM65418]QZD55109.1 Os1348 family NHLP clan protein [Glycomyces sp. TRM65418]
MSDLAYESNPVEQAEKVEAVAAAMDALIGRLGYDESFRAALANNPKETLKASGIVLHKEALEAYMRTQPERFDKASEALFSRVDSDFLMSLSAPSCDIW